MKKVIFLDRDGTIIVEPPIDYQVDSYEKLDFLRGAIGALTAISKLDYELVMVTNQDGLGTESLPTESFQGPHDLMMKILETEGVRWHEVIIDHTRPEDEAETRKPRLGKVQHYLNGDYDLRHSFVIGDRITDMLFAYNLGAKGILIGKSLDTADDYLAEGIDLKDTIVMETAQWSHIVRFLQGLDRKVTLQRDTSETKVKVELNLEGSGQSSIDTGLGFLDHMLDQLGKHGGIDLAVKVDGDLHIDEHHTIEDTALTLGEAFHRALGTKRGIERYGYSLPMDDCEATVLLDFGGRPWLVWDVEFSREKIGDMPTEMFMHFFKSFSDSSKCNLHIKAGGNNEHHKIEAIFKAFARAIKRAVRRDMDNFDLPSTKGVL